MALLVAGVAPRGRFARHAFVFPHSAVELRGAPRPFRPEPVVEWARCVLVSIRAETRAALAGVRVPEVGRLARIDEVGQLRELDDEVPILVARDAVVEARALREQ